MIPWRWQVLVRLLRIAANDVTHQLIRPHTPTDNAEIERCQRTLGERIDDDDFADYAQATRVVAGVIDHYNHHRLHSSLNFLRPVDYYRGNPEALLAERRRKLSTARNLRRQENLQLRQRLIPCTAPSTPIEDVFATRRLARISAPQLWVKGNLLHWCFPCLFFLDKH